jgi:hypothetical protein
MEGSMKASLRGTAFLVFLSACGFCRAQALLDAPGPGYQRALEEAAAGVHRSDLVPSPGHMTEAPSFRLTDPEAAKPAPETPTPTPFSHPLRPVPSAPSPSFSLDAIAPEKAPPGWTPREFNGVTYYWILLGQ